MTCFDTCQLTITWIPIIKDVRCKRPTCWAYSPLSHGGHIVPGDQKALFYHAKPHPHGFHCEAWRGKTKLFWSSGTIWPPCDKGELIQGCSLEKVFRYLTTSRSDQSIHSQERALEDLRCEHIEEDNSSSITLGSATFHTRLEDLHTNPFL